MADFVQTMKNWVRMCASYPVEEDAKNCCEGCRFDTMTGGACNAMFCNDLPEWDWEKVEEIVDDWAKQHPEPKYPTWRQWLIRQGLVDFKPYWSPSIPTGNSTITCLSSKADEPIPADTAEKLGIEPEEG